MNSPVVAADDLLPISGDDSGDPDLDLDLALAFRLQLHEAIAASFAAAPSTSASAPAPDDLQNLALDLQTLVSDRRHADFERLRVADELRSRALAASLEDSDDPLDRPVDEPPFRLYFKGSAIDDRLSRVRLAAIGVAVCDPNDVEVLKVQKAVPSVEASTCRELLEMEALVEGLNAALSLGIKRIDVFCDYRTLYYHVNGIWHAKKNKIAAGIKEVQLLQRKFERCEMFLLPRSRAKFVLRLARDVIVSIISKAESDRSKTVEETCKICLESIDSSRMFTVSTEGTCLHRFCFSCMKQHVEIQLLNGVLPNCPHDGCNVKLNIEGARQFLPAKLLDIMNERLKEASIPANEKIYCPYPKCSALMSVSEAISPEESSSKKFIVDESVLRKCIRCNGSFCIACKVPWHERLPCNVYQGLHKYRNTEEKKLQTLATQKLWRQCVKCSHMIELAEGCFHMTCRCGYEFCYTCGAEWKEKKATCSCPLWDEDNIWYDDSDDSDNFDDDDEEDDYDYENDEDDDTDDNIIDHRRHNIRLL